MTDTGSGGGFFSLPIFGALFGTTDFESHTHQEMLGMLAAANPDTLKDHADQLTDAAKTINDIGEDLKTYITSVPWEGEAGKALEAWGEQTWKATLKLGEYSAIGGTWMGNAAQTLREVKANLPKMDAAAQDNLEAAMKYHNDPDSMSIARDARSKLNEDHAEAVQQMNKLAQSYSFSSFVIGAVDPPTFPPPPESFVPQGKIYDSSAESWSSRGNGGGGATGNGYTESGHQVSKETRNNPPAVTQPQPQLSTHSPDRPVHMEIDGVATLPPTQLPPATTPNGAPPTGRPDGTVLPPVGMIPPVTAGGSGAPVAGGGRPAGFVRPPAPSGQGLSGGGPAGRMPRDSGIVGGRPVPQNSGRPAGGLPRGTVVGGEGTTGRPPMTGGRAGGPMGGPGGGQGIAGGRRLAGETGGPVGGRGQQPGAAGARPFTPGGSGLVRGGAGSGQAGRGGMMPPSNRSARRRREDENGERPDYLTEDEETWQQGSRRIVPPVID
ncbi:hypothetical protein [Streptomyces sp. AK02-01A]|uniref:hypothetical protein n=1 Tax=Streptomyces sp. AK02-01A TaxID=3028648 RepID=UPI0029A3E373|nr:hypothetical protein [Streptomyces sp. AK02-01A]MDX3849092.1 hypothetical protein [Streptomyces sp. AK02-01A]